MGVAPRQATYEDLLNVPEHLVAEIVEGVLYTSPRPAAPHARAAMSAGQDLSPFDRKSGGAGGPPGGWWTLFEPELHLGANVLVPDIAGWRQQRMPVVPNVAFFDLVPDWVCEVVSPHTARVDRVKKVPLYAHHGVRHLWLVEPVNRTVEVFALEGGRWVLLSTHVDSDPMRAVPFEEIEIDLSRWWIDLAP